MRWQARHHQPGAERAGRLLALPSVATFSLKRATRFEKIRSIGLPPILEMKTPLPAYYSRQIVLNSAMDFELENFSASQKQALFDLLILAMYADGHLTSFEDQKLQQVLAAMGFTDEIDRHREFDAAVTRIRPSIQSIHKAKELALGLAEVFTGRKQQKQVYAAVEQLMTSDNNVSTWESTLLMELRMKFRL